MSVYLITYRLMEPEQNYAALYAYFEKYNNGADVGTSAIAIKSDRSAQDIARDILAIVGMHDNFNVFTIREQPPGQNNPNVNAWFAKNI